MSLSRKQILKPRDLPRRLVRVPEWADGDEDQVYIRVLKGSERDAYEVWRGEILAAHEKDADTPPAVRAALVSIACCDERGEPLFGRDSLGDLAELSSVALDRVYDAILCLNGMDRESQEDVRKNSKAPPVAAGCTARPAN